MSEAENTLSIWSLIAEASFVVQLVMLILFLASMVSWVMIFQRGMYQRAMRVALAREEEKLEAGLPFLASVASVSPYIGLFGTVWGIMNSFRGLANVHQTTLATVAPGISEALIATAIGLFAAIPAVLAYNRYSTRAETLMGNYQTFAEEFSAILHRQVHSKQVSA